MSLINFYLYMKTTTDIIQLANLGVDLVIDASTKTTMDLMSIINAAAHSGGHIILKNCDKKTTMDLRYLSINNPKIITIDLT